MSDRMPDKMSKYMSDKMSEYMSDKGEIECLIECQNMSDRMPARLSKNIDYMSKYTF